jgi:anthranilate phosphoribosyltransferase
VHGANGLDEISGESPTTIYQFDRFGTKQWMLDPAHYGVHASIEVIRGGDVDFNASALTAILRGERTPRADLVALNAAFALVIAGAVADIAEGMVQARKSIESGAAAASLEALRGKFELQPV